MLIPFPCARGEMLTGVIAVFALHTLWHRLSSCTMGDDVFLIEFDQSKSLPFCVSCRAVFGTRVVSCLYDQHNFCWANVPS